MEAKAGGGVGGGGDRAGPTGSFTPKWHVWWGWGEGGGKDVQPAGRSVRLPGRKGMQVFPRGGKRLRVESDLLGTAKPFAFKDGNQEAGTLAEKTSLGWQPQPATALSPIP